MIEGLPGDPIRVMTVIAAVVALALSVRRMLRGDGFMPRQVFFVSWVLHAVIFYGVYFYSRWTPPFDFLQPWWPPVLVTHSALMILSLEIWGVIEGESDK